MDFSVIICTYNRAGNLPSCLGKLALQVADIEWEVLVVDNNSSDDTRAMVETLAQTLPIKVRYVFEGEQGLNFARNRGVQESLGRYFSFVDDDITVSPGWLAALFQTLEDNDADAAGSCIHLDERVVLPRWIQPEMLGFLGHQDFGPLPFQMDGVKQYPFGGNMSFNRRVVDRIGLFNTRLGRKGSGRKRGELFKGAETDYFHRLAAAGGRIFYTPDAVVYHQILSFQMEKRYFRTIHFNAGYQLAFHDTTHYPHTLLGAPRFLYRQFLDSLGKYLGQRLSRGPDLAFRQFMTTGHFAGMLLGYYQRRRQPGLV